MLILMRRVGERLMIGDDVIVKILEVEGNRVSIGIEAPKNILVDREEVFNKRREEQGLPPLRREQTEK